MSEDKIKPIKRARGNTEGVRRDAPKKYIPAVVDKFCELVMQGLSINKVCARDDMPSRGMVGKWFTRYPEFQDKYLKAKAIRSFFNVDDMMDIADGADEESSSSVQKAKLKVDLLKWEAARMLPKIYGEMKDRGPLVEVNMLNTGEELEKIAAKIFAKMDDKDE